MAYTFESNPNFTKLTEDSRKAVTQAFEAMSDWRTQMSDLGEKNSTAVFDKMAEAAKSLGWPTEFVEISRRQVASATQMQTQIVDQVMSVWEQQLTNPGQPLAMPKFSAGASNPFGAIPGFGDMSSTPMMPMQIWMQAAEMWQKAWQDSMSNWSDIQKKTMGGK